MSQYLYKYMPYRSHFFREPMIRATPYHVLNDPYECHFNDAQIKNAKICTDIFLKENEDILLKNGYLRSTSKEEINIEEIITEGVSSDLLEVGIISFSTNNLNNLMWSHYADNHKGIVIEFDQNIPFFQDSLKVLNGKKSRFGEDIFGQIFEFPEKVIYKNKLPTYEDDNSILPDSVFGYRFKNFNKSILFTKSNEWEYESEYRSVVKLRDADRIICKDNKYIRKICKEHTEISLIELKDNKIQVTYPREYEMHEEMGDESLKDEIYSASSSSFDCNTICLFRINPDCISSIYLGTRFNDREIDYNKKILGHINIKEVFLDDNDFSFKARIFNN